MICFSSTAMDETMLETFLFNHLAGF